MTAEYKHDDPLWDAFETDYRSRSKIGSHPDFPDLDEVYGQDAPVPYVPAAPLVGGFTAPVMHRAHNRAHDWGRAVGAWLCELCVVVVGLGFWWLCLGAPR